MRPTKPLVEEPGQARYLSKETVKRRRYRVAAIIVFAAIGSFFIYQSFAANANLPGDINNDNKVNLSDLSILLSKWNTNDANTDLNSDGKIGLSDLSILLSNWNKTYTPTTPPTPTPPTPIPTPPTPTPGSVSLLHPATTFTRTNDIAYSTDARNKLDLVIPNSQAPHPVIVYIHGGGWGGGDKGAECPTRMAYYGYTVVCPNYRLSGTAPFPAQTIDNKKVVRWVRANAAKHGMYPDKIGTWGSSAGGHLSSMLGVSNNFAAFDQGENLNQSSSVQASANYCGASDLLEFVKLWPSSNSGMLSGLIGKPNVNGYPTEARYASPTSYVNAGDAAHIFYHGNKDTVIPYQQSELLHSKLVAAGVPSTLHILNNVGHCDSSYSAKAINDQLSGFFDKILRP